MKGTLFERVGGFARIRVLVSALYDKLLESEQLRGYFENVNMRRLVDHQTKFMAALMGGPASFTDEQLARAHAHLGISLEDYSEMAMLFRETLEDFGVDDVEIQRLEAHLLSLQQHVVASGTVARG